MKEVMHDKKRNSEIFLNKIDTVKLFLLLFIVGGLSGFIIEVLYNLIVLKQFHIPGFLYGPFLPIYGWGAMLLTIGLKKFKNHPIILVFLAMLLAGILEYATGVIMYEIWHQRWWDYTSYFLNIDGYVCLMSIIMFGLAGLFVTYVLEPCLRKFIYQTNKKYVNFLCILFLIIYFIDNMFAFVFKNPL